MDWEKIKEAWVRFYKEKTNKEPSADTLNYLKKGFDSIARRLQIGEEDAKFNEKIQTSIINIIATLEKNLSMNDDMVLMRSVETEAEVDRKFASIDWLISTMGIDPQDATLATLEQFYQQIFTALTQITDKFDSIIEDFSKALDNFDDKLYLRIKSEWQGLKNDILEEIESEQFNLSATQNSNFDQRSFQKQLHSLFDLIDKTFPNQTNPVTLKMNVGFDHENFAQHMQTLMETLLQNKLDQNLKITNLILLIALENEVTLKIEECHVKHASFDSESMENISAHLAKKLEPSRDTIQGLNRLGFGPINAKDLQSLDTIKEICGYKDDAFDIISWHDILSSKTPIHLLGIDLSLSYEQLERAYRLSKGIMRLLKHTKIKNLEKFFPQDGDTREIIANFIDSQPEISGINNDQQIFMRGNSFFKNEDNLKLLLPIVIAISLKNESDFESENDLTDRQIASAFGIDKKYLKQLQIYLLELIKYRVFYKQSNSDYDTLHLFGITEMSNLQREQFIKQYKNSDDPELNKVAKEAEQINAYINKQNIIADIENKDLAILEKSLIVLGEEAKILLQIISKHQTSETGSPKDVSQKVNLADSIQRMCLYREKINLINQKLASQSKAADSVARTRKPKSGM